MTKREAKRLVCRIAATTMDRDLGQAGWIYEEDHSEEDIDRIEDAVKELVDELSTRGGGFYT